MRHDRNSHSWAGGGQGAVLAASILARALAEEGKYLVAVPAFGFERRGAPVACFLKVEDKPIRAMTNIYHPDVLLCIDPTVSKAVNIFLGMNRDGVLVQAARGGIEVATLRAMATKKLARKMRREGHESDFDVSAQN